MMNFKYKLSIYFFQALTMIQPQINVVELNQLNEMLGTL